MNNRNKRVNIQLYYIKLNSFDVEFRIVMYNYVVASKKWIENKRYDCKYKIRQDFFDVIQRKIGYVIVGD